VEEFSERAFYLREFRGRTLALVLPWQAEADALAGVAEPLAALAAGGARVLAMAREEAQLAALSAAPLLQAQAPRLAGAVWRALQQSPRVGIHCAGGNAEDFAAQAAALALQLGVFKLVWLDSGGGLRSPDGARLSFVDLAELRVLLAADVLSGDSLLRQVIWHEIAGVLSQGEVAVNVCSPAGLAAELFSYAGSGTLFTRERYMQVRRLGVDDYAAAADLIARGVREGYLAPRTPEQVDALLASGFGAFIALDAARGGGALAGFGALLDGGDGRSGEVAALYTLTRFLGEGVGMHLLRFACQEARARGYARIFACTTSARVSAFFARNGFAEVPGSALPAAKWRGYDSARRAQLRCHEREISPPKGLKPEAGGGL